MTRHLAPLLLLLAVAEAGAHQELGLLRIKVTLADAAQASSPVARYTLLISDNPATREPRRILTAADGTASVPLPPGSYVVESDRPVTFGGRAYQWAQVVEITAGRDAALDLTAANAEIVAVPEPGPATDRARVEDDEASLLKSWQDSVVGVWSPTARASGFLVDARGLIATDQRAIGTAGTVEVQLSRTIKVPARVLTPGSARSAAIVLIDPGLVEGRAPVPIPCPPAAAPPLDDGQEIATITAPHQEDKEVERGEVTALQGREVETDLRVAFGGAGGPVFNQAGALVGLTSVPMDADARRLSDVTVVRTAFICEALSAARTALPTAAKPETTRLPVDPDRAYPAAALADAAPGSASVVPPLLSSSDFDVAILTPPMVSREQQRAGRTGAVTGRSPETAARLGRLTEFGGWSPYFSSHPPVLIVRVTPKLVEGFWKRLGREAARTQGAVLPPFKDFKTSFGRLRATCGDTDVAPIHPFVLEHHMSQKDVVREGLYVFAADAFGPHCGTVSLSFYSEARPDSADLLTIDRAIVDRIWQDFAPYRADTKQDAVK